MPKGIVTLRLGVGVLLSARPPRPVSPSWVTSGSVPSSAYGFFSFCNCHSLSPTLSYLFVSGSISDNGGQAGAGGREVGTVDPGALFKVKGCQRLRGPHTLGPWTSSEESRTKHSIQREAGVNGGRKSRGTERNRERWRTETERDGESTQREVRQQIGQRCRGRPRQGATQGQRQTEKDRQRERHTHTKARRVSLLPTSTLPRASTLTRPHLPTHLEHAGCVGGHHGPWPEPGGQHPGARVGPRALGVPEPGSSG